MRAKLFVAVLLLICFAVAVPAFAQAGYPLKGLFRGDWWVTPSAKQHVVLHFDWVGCTMAMAGADCKLVGQLNPGPDGVDLKNLTLTPPGGGVINAEKPWALHAEADVKDKAGKTVHHVIDGKLSNIGAFDKHLDGTWMMGTQKGTFKMLMQ